MPLTPNNSFEHIKESLIQYLETAYRIAHPAIFAERGEMLRQRGVVAQSPFIEATPAFPTGRKLAELERQYPHILPPGLAELVQHGVPVDRFNLYIHQEQALLNAFSDQPSLLVATGTGSGKTEAFILPILADILREAIAWPAVRDLPRRGEYNAQANVWLHARRHEARPAALRAIVLYPMNALVNDQLSRLRRILSRGDSPDWQRRNLNGNVIHFGMYTGLSLPTGSWKDKWRRDEFDKYMSKIEADWQRLRQDLRENGGWPRPNSPEMLCRWDIQAAPPDIMVTNYSMLEYMLVRPIEYNIFEQTRRWLHDTPDARLTLVLDEAHTYTGAKGTEVAHLVRRLKERLGLEPGSSQFRAIATTASLPNTPGADRELRRFVADLFGEPPDRFSLIQLASGQANLPPRRPQPQTMTAFARFHRQFNLQNPHPAIEQLAVDLNLGQIDHTIDPQVALYNLLEKSEDIAWVRQHTARNATLLDRLAEACWPTMATPEERELATSGVLSAGSYARPDPSSDVPPLLSMRLHAFFRGIAGLWACIDPNCPEVSPTNRGNRPVGKIYTDPRSWCDCGARVLELFSCRRCGLLFVGGVPDSTHGSLWPWSDDLSGEHQDLHDFQIFGVEQPHPTIAPTHRSSRTTLVCHPNDPHARPVFEVEGAKENNQSIGPYPAKCPRCQNYRAPSLTGREIIEPLRTKGPQSFSLVVEDGFRVQPRAAHGEPPNHGRKALLFSDSRQEAAKLAGDLRFDHARDLFRQLLYRALHTCPMCTGSGKIETQSGFRIGQPAQVVSQPCPNCGGSGNTLTPQPLNFAELRRRVIGLQFALGINPTNDTIADFFTQRATGSLSVYAEAERYFDVALRRELSEDEIALEPLGLAGWRIQLPPEDFGVFDPLTSDETRLFLRAIARILASENVLLPPNPAKPWEWPKELVKEFERQVIIPGSRKQGNAIPYNLEGYRKLGRYIIAISEALVKAGRLPNPALAKKWRNDLHWPLWNTLKQLNILQWAGAKIGNEVPFGLRLDSFELYPIGPEVQQCGACAYVMSESLLNVCLRCGQPTHPVAADSLRNYYRRAALHALPGSEFDDPYPLRAAEHTAQIATGEARDLERWFQDLFHDHQNPLDHRVDVLSVTTTMEMGIDIGSLLCVGLRNIPPSVANYQQRAGRAGRRGSAIATVLAFAQQRSHDQYYFSQPPEIVSRPPRVPVLYLKNEVIAHRHVRALVWQDFFYAQMGGQQTQGLFSSWGKVEDFINRQAAVKMRQFLATNRATLLTRIQRIVEPVFHSRLDGWLTELVNDAQQVVNRSQPKDDLFEQLINSGLLPKYAFPVDVVGLSIPALNQLSSGYENSGSDDAMQRDLKIALAEYAPGAEVIRGNFPGTYIYRSAGVYDPFEKSPNYSPTEIVVECSDCQSIALIPVGGLPPDECGECHSPNVMAIPYLRPPGFTVDAALRNAGAESYEGGGRERSGYVTPARLLIGKTAFNEGQPQTAIAPRLYTHVRVGDLFVGNKGPDRDFPGFLICPACGRALDPENPGSHTYPANVPPHWGKQCGPRAGSPCPNRSNFTNQVILGHKFFSEVILLGVDLPDTLDAPYWEPAGRAVWYSFGTLLANAAALVLQVDPGELKVGVRAVRRSPTRLHGEVFLYDDVPGGAGYARAIERNLAEILNKALELGQNCPNPDCPGACYHCLFDYRNQQLHPMLDRHLGAAMLEFLLHNTAPTLTNAKIDRYAANLAEFARAGWKIKPAVTVAGRYFPCVLQDAVGQQLGLWVIHPLHARPTPAETGAILAQTGLRCAVHTTFDLERRPFWVLNNLIR